MHYLLLLVKVLLVIFETFLGLNVFRLVPYFALYLASDSKKGYFLKKSMIFSLKSKKCSTFCIRLT